MSSELGAPGSNGRQGEVRFDSAPDTPQDLSAGSESASGTTTPHDPSQAAKHAKSSSELLRRLSLKEVLTMQQADLQKQYPSLNLTGRIISATFCIPYRLYFQPGRDWVCSLLWR
jgi:trehalose 6-phosphate synthase/phosphatase